MAYESASVRHIFSDLRQWMRLAYDRTARVTTSKSRLCTVPKTRIARLSRRDQPFFHKMLLISWWVIKRAPSACGCIQSIFQACGRFLTILGSASTFLRLQGLRRSTLESPYLLQKYFDLFR